ncbi:MAG: hypothetical protein ACYC3F_05640 [Gemmatimonadaceae bacterium]
MEYHHSASSVDLSRSGAKAGIAPARSSATATTMRRMVRLKWSSYMPIPTRQLAFAAALSLLLAFTLRAQSPTTTVRVLDQRGAPVAHAVLDVGGGSPRIADDSGRITMHFDSDTTTVRVRRMGFSPFFGPVNRAVGGEVTVTLTSAAQRLAAVTVETKRDKTPLERSGFYDRADRAQRGAYTAEFVTPEELDSRPMTRVSDAFRGRKFIKVVPAGSRGSVLQGRAGCAVTILLDGQPVRGDGKWVEPLVRNLPSGRDASMGGGTQGRSAALIIEDIVNIGSVAAIEMYASANSAPAELMTNWTPCGVVAIWTGARH